MPNKLERQVAMKKTAVAGIEPSTVWSTGHLGGRYLAILSERKCTDSNKVNDF